MQTNLNMVAVTGNQQNMDMFNSQVSLSFELIIMDIELHSYKFEMAILKIKTPPPLIYFTLFFCFSLIYS